MGAKKMFCQGSQIILVRTLVCYFDNIASKFQMGPDKLAYTLYFGLAPHFKSELVEEVKKAAWYVVSSDESLNGVLQTCQMDVHIRFWNCQKKTS